MKIAFHGAARTVTGSKHLISLKTGKKILLDCGMFQGLGKQTDDMNRNWGFDPATVDWKTFFNLQQGGGAYFEGYPYQRGYGIESVIRSLYRFLLPIGKEIGKEGLSLGGRILDDIARDITQKKH